MYKVIHPKVLNHNIMSLLSTFLLPTPHTSTMEISRQGFTCAYGRFQALGEDRVETAKLKQLFLPAMTPEAKKLLRDKHYFVSAQLQHYGVQDAAQAGFGQGANVLKKALAAGKVSIAWPTSAKPLTTAQCDKVPDHLVTLEREMRAEWLATRSLSDLAENPQWAMEKYFLDAAGKPDSAKTTGVVGFPLPPFSSYRVSQLREAANRVPGLYEQTARGPSTQTVFIGWDERAVKTTFDFGILEGVMMLSADKGALVRGRRRGGFRRGRGRRGRGRR